MAEFWSNTVKGFRIKVSFEARSQDARSYTSQVRLLVTLYSSHTALSNELVDTLIEMDGQRHTSRHTLSLARNANVVIMDKTVTMHHGTDGEKSFRFTADTYGATGSLYINLSNVRLPKIYQTSTASMGVATIGSGVAITITKNNPSARHTLRYQFGTMSGTIASNIDSSYTWQIPQDLASQIPTSTSGGGTLYVDTYIGSSQAGTFQIPFKASVPSNIKPQLASISLQDTQARLRGMLSANHFAQVLSDIQVTFNGASGVYGSNIISYHAEIVGRSQFTNVNGGRLGLMNYTGQEVVRAWVVDSRGMMSEKKEVTITVLPYHAPVLSFEAVRTRENQAKIQIKRTARIAPLTVNGRQTNTMSLTFKITPSGSTTYTVDHGDASGQWTSVSQLINSAANLGGNYPANRSFTIVGVLEDRFTTTSFTVQVATESVVMSYDKDGRLGVGKVVENGRAGSIDVAGDVYTHDAFLTGEVISRGGSPVTFYGQSRVSDINQSLTAGIYQVTTTTRNQPMSLSALGVLEVIVSLGKSHNNRDNWIWQTYRNTDGRVYTRYKVNGNNWQPWKVPGLDQMYPLGGIFFSTKNTHPAELIGGSWEAIGAVDGVFRWKRIA